MPIQKETQKTAKIDQYSSFIEQSRKIVNEELTGNKPIAVSGLNNGMYLMILANELAKQEFYVYESEPSIRKLATKNIDQNGYAKRIIISDNAPHDFKKMQELFGGVLIAFDHRVYDEGFLEIAGKILPKDGKLVLFDYNLKELKQRYAFRDLVNTEGTAENQVAKALPNFNLENSIVYSHQRGSQTKLLQKLSRIGVHTRIQKLDDLHYCIIGQKK